MRDKIEQILSHMAKGECDPEETIEEMQNLIEKEAEDYANFCILCLQKGLPPLIYEDYKTQKK